jgi:hypothetical protein
MRTFVLIMIYTATGMFALFLAVIIQRFRRFMECRDEGPYGPAIGRSHKSLAAYRSENSESEADLSVTGVQNAEARVTESILNHLGTTAMSCTPLDQEPFTWAMTTEPQSLCDPDPTDAPNNAPLPRGRVQDSGNDV